MHETDRQKRNNGNGPGEEMLRGAGIRAEIYPDAAKMKKQMSYANAKMVPFVAIVGENSHREKTLI